MSTCRFSVGTEFRWDDVLYEVNGLFPDNDVNIENAKTGSVRLVQEGDLLAAYFTGDLVFEVGGRPARSKDEIGNAIECLDLSDYPPEYAELARWRQERIVNPLKELGDQCTLADVEALVAEVKASLDEEDTRMVGKGLSVRSAYRWKASDKQKHGSDRLILDVNGRGGVGQSRTDPEVEAITLKVIQKKAKEKGTKVTIVDLTDLIAAAVDEENARRPDGEKLAAPSESTIRRRVEQLDLYERFAARHGARAAKRQFTQYGQMDYPKKAGERVELDATPADIMTVDETDYLPVGRPYFYKGLDCATRYVWGHYLGFDLGYYGVMECLFNGIWMKPDVQELYGTEHPWLSYGLPYSIFVDNAKEFIGDDLEDACLVLDIILKYAPVRTPHFKAAIERYLRTCNGLFHALRGTTFSNILERGDYQSEKQACMTLSDLEQAYHIFMVDIYAERRHKGLKGVPARRWEQAMEEGYSPRLPASANDLLILLGRVNYRNIWHYGIDLHNIRYNSPDLALLRNMLKGEKTKLKWHPGNLGTIYVHDPFHDLYIPVPAIDQDYANGMSWWKHRVVCAYLRRHEDHVDRAALGRAKAHIQEIVNDALRRRRRSGGKKLGRWQEGGRPPSLTGPQAPNYVLADVGVRSELTVVDGMPDDQLKVDRSTIVLKSKDDADSGWGIRHTGLDDGAIPSQAEV